MAIFTNQATLSYADRVTNSNVVTGELLEILSLTKDAVRSTYAQGDSVAYVVSLVNSGTTALNNLTVTDDLGSYVLNGDTVYPLNYVDGTVMYYMNGVLQAAPSVTAGPPLVISGINVPAGGTVILVYEAQTTSFADPGIEGTITNIATVSGAGLSTEISDSATITAVRSPNLTISKSMSPMTVSDNGTLTYTFVIQNSGNTEADAADRVSLTDTFDPILSNVSVTYNGLTWTEPGQYSYDESTGVFTTVPGQITVPAAQYTQDPVTGIWEVTPGVSVVVVTGTV